MRNIKTSIAVLLTIGVLQLLGTESPFYACIAAVITMQNQVKGSFQVGVERMIGTLIGAGLGMVFALIQQNNPFLIALGIALVIYSTNILKQCKSASIACIVFLAIMTNLTTVSPVQYSILRVIETLIGIYIAVLVNVLIYPPSPEEEQNCPG